MFPIVSRITASFNCRSALLLLLLGVAGGLVLVVSLARFAEASGGLVITDIISNWDSAIQHFSIRKILDGLRESLILMQMERFLHGTVSL
jgi:hypothetical protein